jgi:8-oxo-dGTP pyrophosphatase MutT (NUDIX family)
MSVEKLVGCVIADADSQVYLLHRPDHDQWQLPGGRITDEDFDIPRVAAERHAWEELNISGSRIIRALGSTPFSQWGKDYECEWFLLDEYKGEPFPRDRLTYDHGRYFNLFRKDIAHIKLSANVQALADKLVSGAVVL